MLRITVYTAKQMSKLQKGYSPDKMKSIKSLIKQSLIKYKFTLHQIQFPRYYQDSSMVRIIALYIEKVASKLQREKKYSEIAIISRMSLSNSFRLNAAIGRSRLSGTNSIKDR